MLGWFSVSSLSAVYLFCWCRMINSVAYFCFFVCYCFVMSWHVVVCVFICCVLLLLLLVWCLCCCGIVGVRLFLVVSLVLNWRLFCLFGYFGWLFAVCVKLVLEWTVSCWLVWGDLLLCLIFRGCLCVKRLVVLFWSVVFCGLGFCLSCVWIVVY